MSEGLPVARGTPETVGRPLAPPREKRFLTVCGQGGSAPPSDGPRAGGQPQLRAPWGWDAVSESDPTRRDSFSVRGIKKVPAHCPPETSSRGRGSGFAQIPPATPVLQLCSCARPGLRPRRSRPKRPLGGVSVSPHFCPACSGWGLWALPCLGHPGRGGQLHGQASPHAPGPPPSPGASLRASRPQLGVSEA